MNGEQTDRTKLVAGAHPEAACADLALVLPHPDLADARRVSADAAPERPDAHLAQRGAAHTAGNLADGRADQVPVSGRERAAHIPADMDGGDNSSRAHSSRAHSSRAHSSRARWADTEAEAAGSR